MELDEDDINDVLDQCSDAEESGESMYPSMSYEQGAQAAIRWMQGDGSNPMED